MVAELHSSLKVLVAEAVKTADRRRTRRISLPLKLRYQTSDQQEHRGRILNISPQGALIRALPGTAYGDKVIVYIDKIGRFNGEVVRIERDGFAVKFNLRKQRAARIADTLTWLVNDGESHFNRRQAQRIRQSKSAIAILADGTNVACRILDISMTGASVGISPKPKIGQILTVGKMQAQVMRHHDEGIGIMFMHPHTKQKD